jgi:hypothetical protein
MKKLHGSLLLVLLALALGCQRDAPSPTPPLQVTPHRSATPAPLPEPAVPAPAPPAAPSEVATAAPGTRASTQSEIDVYNKVLAEYCLRASDIPTDLADLKQRRALPPLPTPPPGKRLVYRPDLKTMDYRTAKITLE